MVHHRVIDLISTLFVSETEKSIMKERKNGQLNKKEKQPFIKFICLSAYSPVPPYSYTNNIKNHWPQTSKKDLMVMKMFEVLWELLKCGKEKKIENRYYSRMKETDVTRAELSRDFNPKKTKEERK